MTVADRRRLAGMAPSSVLRFGAARVRADVSDAVVRRSSHGGVVASLTVHGRVFESSPQSSELAARTDLRLQVERVAPMTARSGSGLIG